MSLNTVAPITDLTGSGDASRGRNLQPSELKSSGKHPASSGKNTKRVPVPVCRRFNSATPVNKTVQHQLQLELNKVTTFPNKQKTLGLKLRETPIQKRSNTMSDMSPIINKNRKSNSASLLETSFAADDGLFAKKLRRRELLFRGFAGFTSNLVKCQREHLSALKEKVADFEEQISQLNLQTSVLQNLRENESSRRSEALGYVQHYKREIESLSQEFSVVTEERDAFENVTKMQNDQLNRIQMDVENLKNEIMMLRAENIDYYEQLLAERDKLMVLRSEKQHLIDKTLKLNDEANQQQENIEKLRKIAEELEAELQNKNASVRTASKLKDEANEKAIQLQLSNETLEFKLKENEKAHTEMEGKLKQIQKTLCTLENNNLLLKLDNGNLKIKLEQSEEELSLLTNKSWKSSVIDATKIPMKFLLQIAVLMLPALPPM